MPRTTPRAINVKIKRSASTTVPARSAGRMRCSTWSKKSVAYISESVRRVTAFFASNWSMSRPTRLERRRPLVCTANPSDSSHSCSSVICVERPEPSMPSITIKLPVISLGSNPTSGSPKKCSAESSSGATAAFAEGVASGVTVPTAGVPVGSTVVAILSFSFSCSGILAPLGRVRREAFQIDLRCHDVAHLLLELVDGQRSVEDDEIIGVHHLVVLLENARLKQAKTFGAIVGQPQVHARFVILQFRAAAQNTAHRDVERRAKIKGDVRDGRKAVKVAEPARRAAAGGVARECGVDVAIGQHEVVALEQWHDLTLATVGKVGSVQQRERGGCQQAALLSAAGRGFHQRRGIPLREVQAVAADFEPSLQ